MTVITETGTELTGTDIELLDACWRAANDGQLWQDLRRPAILRYAVEVSAPAAKLTTPDETVMGAGHMTEGTASTGSGANAVTATARPRRWRRVWQRLMPTLDAELVLGQLNNQLAVLEGARAELEAGWVQGGWWSVSSADGTSWLVTGSAAIGGIPGQVHGACLVGAIARAGSQLSTAVRSDAGRAVDAVYDALWASRGQADTPRTGGLPPVPSPEVRLVRVRALTQWNDQAERTQAEVLAVVDRAISATIMDLMSAPRPEPAKPALVG